MENYREAMLAWQEHEEHNIDCDKLQVYSTPLYRREGGERGERGERGEEGGREVRRKRGEGRDGGR